jgi:hypothetical protein
MPTHNLPFSTLNSLLLDEKKVIRVYVNVGAAFSNQAANLNLIRHIRSMGYKGKFELIYSDLVRDKIQSLFGLPDNIPAIVDESDGIVFYAMSEYLQRYLNCDLPPVQLAITGAWDDYKVEPGQPRQWFNPC